MLMYFLLESILRGARKQLFIIFEVN